MTTTRSTFLMLMLAILCVVFACEPEFAPADQPVGISDNVEPYSRDGKNG